MFIRYEVCNLPPLYLLLHSGESIRRYVAIAHCERARSNGHIKRMSSKLTSRSKHLALMLKEREEKMLDLALIGLNRLNTPHYTDLWIESNRMMTS